MVEIKSKRTMTEIQEDLNTVFELAIEEAHAEGEEWDGTIPESLFVDMEGLEIERDAKVDGVIRAVKDLKGGVALLKAEKKALDARIASKEGKMNGYKEYLKYVLNGSKFESVGGQVWYKDTPSVVYSSEVQEALDNGNVPKGFEDFIVEKTTITLPKKAVGDYIKAGDSINGARIEVKKSVIIK